MGQWDISLPRGWILSCVVSQIKAYRITKLRSNNTLPSVRHVVSRSPTDKAQYWNGRWKYVTLARGRVELHSMELPAVYRHIPRKRCRKTIGFTRTFMDVSRHVSPDGDTIVHLRTGRTRTVTEP